MRKFIQWGILYALMIIGFMAFLVLAGEDNPYDPMPLFKFFILKVSALAVLGCCVWIGKVCNSKGLLPDIKEE